MVILGAVMIRRQRGLLCADNVPFLDLDSGCLGVHFGKL